MIGNFHDFLYDFFFSFLIKSESGTSPKPICENPSP